MVYFPRYLHFLWYCIYCIPCCHITDVGWEYTLFFPLNDSLTIYDVIKGSILQGFTEEFLYRAFLFGIFFYIIRLGSVPLVILISVLFESAHLFQTGDILRHSEYSFLPGWEVPFLSGSM